MPKLQDSMRSLEERPILEQTIGSAVLDRFNGYPVGSLAEMYKALGGTNPAVVKVLEQAFGENFDEHANKGKEHLASRLKHALRSVLAEEKLVAPTTKGFRDMLLHLNPDPNFHAFEFLNRPVTNKPESEK
jgi:hypothetical protein